MSKDLWSGYGRDTGTLAGYASVVSVYHLLFGAFLLGVRHFRVKLPERIGLADSLLLGIATYKLSRVITKDSVTSFIRAPFTIYRGVSGPSELKEDVRGSGERKSFGELLTCPFCLAVWISSILTYGLVFQPRLTRLVATIFTVTAISDGLQYGVEALRKAAESGGEK